MVLLAGTAVAQEAELRFLTPAEIAGRLEKAKVKCRVAGIETLQDVGRGTLADQTWKPLVPPIEYPRVRRKNGQIVVESWPRPPAASVPMQRGEQAFQQKDYAQAATWYRKTLEIAPDFYIAHAYLGDTHLFGAADPRAALAEYELAIAANPDDYRLYFFRANARRRLGQPMAMLDDLRRSLVLKPRNPILIGALEKARGLMGRAEPDVFVPHGFVRKEGGAVVIYADTARPEWLAWGRCKALWLIDEGHRKALLGSAAHGWSTVEELECLAALISTYEVRKARGVGPGDDRLDTLRAIIADDLAPAFVVYELGSRVDPQIVLRLDPDFRQMMSRYVEKYVLTPH